jgi:perosamine synthetase
MSKELAFFGGQPVRYREFPTGAVIGEEEKKAVMEVLDSGNLSGFIGRAGNNFGGGPTVLSLEHDICEYFGVKHCVSMNSATSCLHAALIACGVGAGDEVIVPPYTMSATATAVLMQNAFPIFVDVDADDCCINPELIEEAITSKTKAIIVVHLFGRPTNMTNTMLIAKKHNLYVIEDCAQAMGAKHDGQFVGTWGDIGVFSFNQHKVVTCGEGGVAITNDAELSFKMSLVRNHGEAFIDDEADEYQDPSYTQLIGYNYRMTELDAAIACEQFKKLDHFNLVRCGLAKYLSGRLSQFDDLYIHDIHPNDTCVYFTLPIHVLGTSVVGRKLLAAAINAEGIPINEGYTKPLYLAPVYQSRNNFSSQKYEKGLCPIAESLYEKHLMLISVCRMPNKISDMDDVVDAFRKVFDCDESLRDF